MLPAALFFVVYGTFLKVEDIHVSKFGDQEGCIQITFQEGYSLIASIEIRNLQRQRCASSHLFLDLC
ncbi:hypothetical protein RA20_18070 [Leisingera sp. ANG-Vp]|nr:hypothetical protein RA20_18070 [Leisingera sp. ANG-Vp]